MIILDTNVLSEVMAGGSGVQRWFDRVSPPDLYTTVMTRAEIRYGLALLPDGRRRHDLTTRADVVFDAVRDRLLPFDAPAADRYGTLMADRRRSGKPISAPDAIIASICWVHRASLCTRNVNDFGGCDIEVINPFEP